MIEHIADPVCGYRLKPNQQGYVLASLAHINRWGYRGKDWPLEKPAHTVRIAVVGASLAFGHGIEDDATYAAQLEKILNNSRKEGDPWYEVLNFGIPGYDIGHSLKCLRTDVLKFHPDIAIMNFFFLDLFYIKDYGFYPRMFELEKKNFSSLRWNFLNLCRHSRLAMYLWDRIKKQLKFREPDELDRLIEAYVEDGVTPPDGPNRDGWTFVTEKLAEFGQSAKENHFKPFYMMIPPYQEIFQTHPKSTYAQYLAAQCRQFGIEPLLLASALRESGMDPKEYLIPYDFHFKPRGHQFIAEFLAKQILDYEESVQAKV